MGLKILQMKQDDMNKQESYKTYMILMIFSDGNQNNVFLFLFTADRHFVRFAGRRYRPPQNRYIHVLVL